MTMVAMDDARRRLPKASYKISNHSFSRVMSFWKDFGITYRRKNKIHDSAVSPCLSDPNQGRNESHTGGKCSSEVEDKHEVGSSLHSVHAVLNCRWPFQICEFDATLELVLDNGCRVEVKERSLVGAEGDVLGGLGC